MNIDITAQDYFEELKLMEIQYKQEEALYPWVYMILQMVECRKKYLRDSEYEKVSIRDVHNARKGLGKLSGTQRQTRELITIPYVKAVPDFVLIDENCKELLGCVEIKAMYKSDVKIDGAMKELSASQMKSHIKSFKKVLYTNGLQFCMFTLCPDEKHVKVTELANLRETYTEYKEIDANATDADKVKIIKKASEKWEELIIALICIDWNDEPTTIIPQVEGR